MEPSAYSMLSPITSPCNFAYVGSHGVGLLGMNDANAPAPGSGWETYNGLTGSAAACTPGAGPAGSISTVCQNMTRPFFSKFPYLSDINQLQNIDASNYNALQVTLTQRPWHGMNYLLGYVFSHCMEMGSGDWNGAALPSDVYNPRADYGDCLTDVRQKFDVVLHLRDSREGKDLARSLRAGT